MKFSKVRPREAPRSAAFLDVIFILMITFFLVTTLAEEEARKPELPRVSVQLPILEKGGESGESQGQEPLRLVVSAEGRIEADGADLGAAGTGLRALEALFERRRASGALAAALVYTDEAATAQHLLPLLALLREAQVERIELLGRRAGAEGSPR